MRKSTVAVVLLFAVFAAGCAELIPFVSWNNAEERALNKIERVEEKVENAKAKAEKVKLEAFHACREAKKPQTIEENQRASLECLERVFSDDLAAGDLSHLRFGIPGQE